MTYFLPLLIFAEGYVVLATELLAVRLMIPMVGAGTDTVSVIIAGVLMPLAFGYYAGGNYRAAAQKQRRSIRRKLLWNMVVAGFFLSLGLSMIVIEKFFGLMEAAGLHNRVLETTVYALCFLVYPVFLLGQTIPLASNFFAKEALAQITGKMLAFSTFGSFLGSVFTTIVLMTKIGVHNTVIVNIGILALIVWALSRRRQFLLRGAALAIFALTFGLNNDVVMDKMGVASNNSYSTVKMAWAKKGDSRVLILNNSFSAGYSDTQGAIFEYVQYINKHYILPIMNDDSPPKDILLLGGGGFTIGIMDRKNNYTYVDINPDIKRVAEKFLLRQNLSPNKRFVPQDARSFIRKNDQKYDMIVLDAYAAIKAVPEYLVTQEYFFLVRRALKENGVVVMNFIVCPGFEDVFSVRIDNTIRSVFPHVNRTVVSPVDFNAWKNYQNTAGDCAANVIYATTLRTEGMKDGAIYSDNINTSFMDKGKAF